MDIGNERKDMLRGYVKNSVRGKSKSSSPMTFDAFEISEDNWSRMFPTPFWASAVESLAEMAAEIYAAAEITVMMPPEHTPMSTPELSFAIRNLGAQGGSILVLLTTPRRQWREVLQRDRRSRGTSQGRADGTNGGLDQEHRTNAI